VRSVSRSTVTVRSAGALKIIEMATRTRLYTFTNRVRCFVCDVRGGHSCIDLVVGFLRIGFGEAVNWIAERFTVPNVKVGRPVGSRAKEPQPYRVGSQGSELEVLVRSGMFGQLSPAERSILIALVLWRDAETGLTQLSYASSGDMPA
jgi:hypothetical protein